jgi:hypothetical protein
MPPTIIFTVGSDEFPEPLLEQAVAALRASAPIAAAVRVRLNMRVFLSMVWC